MRRLKADLFDIFEDKSPDRGGACAGFGVDHRGTCESAANLNLKSAGTSRISLPEGKALEKSTREYSEVGCTGGVASCDVTHVPWSCFPSSLQRILPGKEGCPTIAYQAIVDHCGRVLAVTRGFPGVQNDKSIIRHDAAVTRIREDPIYRERQFHLRKEDGTWSQHKGLYLLVGKGYPKWATLMPPMQAPLNMEEHRWSQKIESVRKDVETFFGVLEGRFRILKVALDHPNKTDIDNMFFTCCILHNMLHAFDGLDVLEKDVDWAGADGLHDA